jgi:SAM-dependent methyltransferase
MMQSQQRDWNELATLDPFWAVLSDDTRRNGGWDEDAFFSAGEREIANVFAALGEQGIAVSGGVGLDFGCGLGRLTRALASRFPEVVGLDIAPEMVRQATALNAGYPVRFLVNESVRLPFADASFQFVYTSNVLQHLPGRADVVGYLKEFVRVLEPGGVLVFQLPHLVPWRNRLQPRRHAYHVLRGLGLPVERLYRLGLHPIRMIALPAAEVARAIAPARIIFEEPGRGAAVNSTTYYVRR